MMHFDELTLLRLSITMIAWLTAKVLHCVENGSVEITNIFLKTKLTLFDRLKGTLRTFIQITINYYVAHIYHPDTAEM